MNIIKVKEDDLLLLEIVNSKGIQTWITGNCFKWEIQEGFGVITNNKIAVENSGYIPVGSKLDLRNPLVKSYSVLTVKRKILLSLEYE